MFVNGKSRKVPEPFIIGYLWFLAEIKKFKAKTKD